MNPINNNPDQIINDRIDDRIDLIDNNQINIIEDQINQDNNDFVQINQDNNDFVQINQDNNDFVQINQDNENLNQVNRNNGPPTHYYLWYCMRHGECFLTSRNIEPGSQHSRCGVLNQCYYDYLGIITVDRNGPRLYIEHRVNIRMYFDERNDGYTLDMLDNLVNSPELRNAAILF